MRVLLLSQHFLPEPPPIAYMVDELTRCLVQRGHEVHLVTGFPSYPTRKLYEGSSPRLWDYRLRKGVHVHRVWSTNYGARFLRRLLFFLTWSVAVKMYCRRLPRPDVIYTEVPPPSSAQAVIKLGRYFKCPSIARFQDMHPDSAIASGFIRHGILIHALRRQEHRIYDGLEKILVIAEDFSRALEKKGLQNGKVSVCPNWIDSREIRPRDRYPNPFRHRLGIPKEKRIVLYAGTMGRSHGTRVFVEAARLIANVAGMKNVLFVLAGRGHERNALERYVHEEKLPNVLIIDPVPREDLSDMLSMADLTLVSLKPGYSNFSVPSKLLGYMAVGRPVLALVDEHSDIARIIQEAECGEVLRPGDSKGVVEAVGNWLNDDPLCHRAGNAARQYCIEHLSAGVLLDRLACQIEMVCK